MARLERNIEQMEQRILRLEANLRPHVKTHKIPEIARLQTTAFSGGITVSTLAEAEHFAAAGFQDITWALPLPPNRIKKALKLGERIQLNLLIDHTTTLQLLRSELQKTGQQASVFLKVDCGYGRAGVLPSSEEGLVLARELHQAPEISFQGLLTHGGHSYDMIGQEAILKVAEEERNSVVDFAHRLRALNIPIPCVSIGSTPTMCHAKDLTGVDEVRPGNYVFFDRAQQAIGSCQEEDIALSVLSSVIGLYPERKLILIDAGGLALSKDGGSGAAEFGYGTIVDPLYQTPLPFCKLVALSQEHGKIRYTSDKPPLSIGEQVRILPNHSCMTAACHPQLYAVRGSEVEASWAPARGW